MLSPGRFARAPELINCIYIGWQAVVSDDGNPRIKLHCGQQGHQSKSRKLISITRLYGD